MVEKKEALEDAKAEADETKEALSDVKSQMKEEMSAAKSLVKDTKAAKKEIAQVKAEADKATAQKEKLEKEIEESHKFQDEATIKAKQVQVDIDRIQGEMKTSGDELVGVETEAQMAEREAHEAELKLKANLLEREDLIIERVGLRATQVNWEVIGEAEFEEPDALTEIEGLDEFSQKKLNALGIITLEQLSRMDAATADVINDALEFPPSRIRKMMWAEQARQLMSEQ
jgi:predicted flap endonuclease-1-like 5' DNA nuclease